MHTANTRILLERGDYMTNEKLDSLRREINELVKKYAAIAYEPQPFVPGETPVMTRHYMENTKDMRKKLSRNSVLIIITSFEFLQRQLNIWTIDHGQQFVIL